MLNRRSKIALVIAVIIMTGFMAVQMSIILQYVIPTYKLAIFSFECILAFLPFFFLAVIDFVKKAKDKDQNINDKMKAINSSNVIVEFDLNGNILTSNNLYCDYLGYTLNEVIGSPQLTHWDSEDWKGEKYYMFWFNMKVRNVTTKGEFKFITKDKKEIWLYGNYTPIKNQYDEPYKIILIATNITTKKAIEREVDKKNGYLEHAAKILRHDMHSGINTYIPRGLSSLKRRLSEEQIKELKIDAPLRMIDEGLIHTQKVYKGVKEFTNLVKTDSKLNTDPYNLKQILTSYLETTSYGKQVIISDLPEVEVNDALFCTAVDNLIRNGLKYNDAPTKLVKIYMENNNTLIVEDNGRGMSQEDFVELAKPYTRKEGQKEQGSGLGLNICVAIIEEHGFKMSAEKLEQGTKLKIKIK
jgi:PAS domain S-box-containing protein